MSIAMETFSASNILAGIAVYNFFKIIWFHLMKLNLLFLTNQNHLIIGIKV